MRNSCLENSVSKESKPSKQNISSKGASKRDQKSKNSCEHDEREVACHNVVPTEKAGKLTQSLAAVEHDDNSLSQVQSQGNLGPEATVHTDEEDASRYEIDLVSSPQMDFS